MLLHKRLDFHLQVANENGSMVMPVQLHIWGEEKHQKLIETAMKLGWGNNRQKFREVSLPNGSRLSLGLN